MGECLEMEKSYRRSAGVKITGEINLIKKTKREKNPIFLKLTKEFVQDDNGEDDATEKVDIKGCEVSNL